MNSTHNKDLNEAEKIIGYVFTDKENLRDAFTHSSFSNENKNTNDYQRLEFLGDAILDLSVGFQLFKRFPTAKEGVLTKKRAMLVSADTLSEIIDEYGLIAFMRVGTGHVAEDVIRSKNVKCDLFESIVGAIYLDSGCNLPVAERFIWDKLEKYIDRPQVDYKSKTLEYCAQNKYKCELKTFLSEENVPERRFFSQFYVRDELFSTGEGQNKAEAEKEACKIFYKNCIEKRSK